MGSGFVLELTKTERGAPRRFLPARICHGEIRRDSWFCGDEGPCMVARFDHAPGDPPSV